MKLNNYFINPLCVILIGFCCYSCISTYGVNNQINNYHDEFKNINVKSLRLNISSSYLFDEITNVRLNFYEENGSNKLLYLNIYRNPLTLPIEKTLYLKTDDNIFKIPLAIVKSSFQSENLKTETTTIQADSTGSTTKTETGSSQNEYFVESFKTDLNDELMASIVKTNTLIIRLYSGSTPVSFTINPQKLNLIKKLAETKI